VGVYLQRRTPGDRRFAHTPRYHRRVAGHAAQGRQHAFSAHHTFHVIGVGLFTYQDHRFPGSAALGGLLGRQDNLARGRSGGRSKARAQDLDFGYGVHPRVEQLLQLARIYAQ
jgi:hypothetical protein